ncbi:lyase family protein [Nocardioides pocheonensis]|uniref:3-carboxy-cis,cis-muconate cycloisomerase n=1 Tax=Nocardioides pocheonensis TaxID=661485 RepID=A0A3N0GX74_9ACTN|nr:lyase family protein [Nocardioides pocheonensis]RNM17021.1 3-carboxy-cis,cis-muconate cycloisomerase [Nocardioides pocheonensis]
MADLFWPGDERAGELFGQGAFLAAMVRVESAWLGALVTAGIAPTRARADLDTVVGPADLAGISAAAESGGNPVIALVDLLRTRGGDAEAASWIHRGLTSQDVVDTALMLCARDAVGSVLAECDQQAERLAHLADLHRGTVMAGRTLTQHAVPITFGLKVARWLEGLLDAREQLAGVRLPAQLGGAVGTLAATVELARLGDVAEPAKAARSVTSEAAAALGLDDALPWHTNRSPVTRLADALVATTDAYGRIANDVLVLARPEIGEVAEAAGRGGSSTMPHKANPILSVLVRRAALAAPALAAQLHLAAAESVDERADGGWHVEWSALSTLARRAVVAASQTTELLEGLRVDRDRMAANAQAAASSLLAEQASIAAQAADGPAERLADYLGASEQLVDAVLARYHGGTR